MPTVEVLLRSRVGRRNFRCARARYSPAATRKPAVPQAGSQMVSSGRRRHQLDHQPDDVARGAELAVLAGGGDLAQHVFVEVALGVAIVHGDLVDQVHNPRQERWRGDGEARVLHVLGVGRAVAARGAKERKDVLVHDGEHLGGGRFRKRDQRRSAWGRPFESSPPGKMGRSILGHHPACAGHRLQLQAEFLDFAVDDRRLEDDEAAPEAVVRPVPSRLHRRELVGDGRDHAQREGRVRQVPLLVAEPPIVRGGLVPAAELGADRGIDQLGQDVRGLDVRAQPEEDVPRLAGQVLLAPHAAIAEIREDADAVVERDALLAVRLVHAPLTGRLADLDIGQRQVVAVEQLGDLGGRRQRLALGAAVVDGLGAQAPDAQLELVEGGSCGVRSRMHSKKRPTMGAWQRLPGTACFPAMILCDDNIHDA